MRESENIWNGETSATVSGVSVWQRYAYLMYRTRYIGIVVSVIIVLLAIGEIFNTINAVNAIESPISPDLAANIRNIFTGDIFVGLAFAIRGLALWNFKKLRYPVLTIFFWVCVAAVFTDIYLDLPPEPYNHCTEGKICFGIYEMSVVSILNFAGRMYILGSIVRIAVTFAAALFRQKDNELNSYS